MRALLFVHALGLIAGCRIGFTSVGVDVSGDVSFDQLACTGSSSTTVTLTNNNAGSLQFTVTSTVGAVTVTPASGTVAAGASAPLVVTVTAPPESIPGASIDGDLVIATDDASTASIDVPIHLTTSGGVIVLDQASLDFGQVQNLGTATRTLTFHNTGNTGVDLSAGAFTSSAYAISGAPTVHLDGGGSGAFAVTFMPQLIQSYADTLPLTVTGSLCRPPPASVPVSGAAITGTILLDHTLLDFGPARCGDNAQPLALTITNTAGATTYSASITAASGTYDVTPAGGALPAGDTSLTVTREAVAVPTMPGTVTGTLHLDVASPPEGQDVTLQDTVVGPWLESDQTSLDHGLVDRNTSSDLTVQVTNAGNDIADVQIVPVGGSSTSFTVSPTALQIAPGDTQPVVFTFTNHDNFAPSYYHPDSIQTRQKDFAITATDQCSTTLTIHTSAMVVDN